MSNFTIIHHDIRISMGLSCNEYCVADLIKRLSDNSPDGWCFASRSKIGEMMGLSKPSVISILSILVSLKLVDSHPRTKDLKVTDLWLSYFSEEDCSLKIGQDSLPKRIRNYTVGKKLNGKESYQVGQDSLPEIGQDSLPPSYKEIYLKGELEIEDSVDENSIMGSKEKKTEKKFDPMAIELPFQSEEFKTAWMTWVSHRKDIKKPLTETTVKAQVSKLLKYTEEKAIEGIINTVEKGWTGLYFVENEKYKGIVPLNPNTNPEPGKIEKALDVSSRAAARIKASRQ